MARLSTASGEQASASATDTTRRLAAFAADLRLPAIPDPARERAKDLVIDAIACAFAGRAASETPAVLAFARSLGASSESDVIGGDRLSVAGATIANAYLITAVTMCDIHRPTTCHVTPEVVGAALVGAQRDAVSGGAFLTAVTAGLEITTRVGLGLDPTVFRQRQWHMPGVSGPFGAAAAVGSLLGLDAARMNDAFGIAGSQSAGTYVHLGTPTVKFHQARGALSGLMAANLANEGFSASTDVLADPSGGLFAVYGGGGNPAAALDGLGADWELERISLRPWPVAVHLQPVATALMALLDRGVDARSIASVEVTLSELAYQMHGTMGWDAAFRAKVSAPYTVGVVLLDRRCWLDQFTEERIADPAVGAFVRERVVIRSSAEIRNGQTLVEVRTSDGEVLVERVDAARGEPANPLSRADIGDKFRVTAAATLGDRTDEVLGRLEAIEDEPDVRRLIAVLGEGDR